MLNIIIYTGAIQSLGCQCFRGPKIFVPVQEPKCTVLSLNLWFDFWNHTIQFPLRSCCTWCTAWHSLASRATGITLAITKIATQRLCSIQKQLLWQFFSAPALIVSSISWKLQSIFPPHTKGLIGSWSSAVSACWTLVH